MENIAGDFLLLLLFCVCGVGWPRIMMMLPSIDTYIHIYCIYVDINCINVFMYAKWLAADYDSNDARPWTGHYNVRRARALVFYINFVSSPYAQ